MRETETEKENVGDPFLSFRLLARESPLSKSPGLLEIIIPGVVAIAARVRERERKRAASLPLTFEQRSGWRARARARGDDIDRPGINVREETSV